MALEAEGFSDLKINVGDDGSMIVSQAPDTIILTVPAPIKSKEVQNIIIEILSTTIKCYNNNLLTLQIVNEAKSNNNYYNKIALIKYQKKNA